ncbi:hypothetical protein ACRAWF_15490 [Streptomyces sp. L7]
MICCWKIEEDFQLGKSACGLDQGQTNCWNFWMRWTFISMLAAAVLTVTRLRTTAHATCGRLVPVSARELLRLLRVTVLPSPTAAVFTCRTGSPGAANTSTMRPKYTAAGTTSPPPRRHGTANMIKDYSCRV